MKSDEERQIIRQELEALRLKGVRRRELSLHACERLFFDLGICPSITTVRDLTQTGSASDIPKDIDYFWQRIREVSKVRINAGPIPKVLEDKAGELLATLFDEVQNHAQQLFETQRQSLLLETQAAKQCLHEAEIRCQTANDKARHSESQLQTALVHIHELETRLTTLLAQQTTQCENLQYALSQLKEENEKLTHRIEAEQALNTTLRERVEALHQEMRKNAEYYAQQIKEAVTQAEQRVKPLLVELDSLRAMAATYQTGIREANRKEFDFIQQLSVAKARADQLDAQVRHQADEISLLMNEAHAFRKRSDSQPKPIWVALFQTLANTGRLTADEITALGTLLDEDTKMPESCPKCSHVALELIRTGDKYELFCSECEHTSEMGSSRFEVITRFLNTPSVS